MYIFTYLHNYLFIYLFIYMEGQREHLRLYTIEFLKYSELQILKNFGCISGIIQSDALTYA